ncbi:MAG TPA: hypothetical protein P5317_07655 [Myxococcota bacterium]|nr:hypothetical protein [Myxococcota bacterium]HRV17871.1 hypothetical protein [Myxococcota bacterium]
MIPTDSTEFPAGAGAGVFSTIGFYRSYYADVDGSYLLVQPTSVGECEVIGSYVVSRQGCAFNPTTLDTKSVTIVSVYDGGNILLSNRIIDQSGNVFASAGYTIRAGECDEYVQTLEACFTVNANPTVVRNGYKVVWNEHGAGAWTPLAYIQGGPDSLHITQTFTPSQVTETTCPREYNSSVVLCDGTKSFMRHFRIREDGTSSWIKDTELDATTGYAPVGTVVACDEGTVGEFVLCDDTGSFIRKFVQDHDGTVNKVANINFDGTAHIVVGTVRVCTQNSQTNHLIPACDTIGGTPTPATCTSGTPVSLVAPDIQDSEQKNPTTGGNAVNVNDNDLEIAGQAEPGETDYAVAVRFNLNVPQGATICSAYVQFTAEGNVSNGVMDITIDGEDVDSSVPFTTTAGSTLARTRTTASVAWSNIPQWANNQAGVAQQTPDISTVIQEIVNRSGFAQGNPVALFFVPGNTGYRRASSITDGAEAPQLHVTYVIGTGSTVSTCQPFYIEVDSTGAPTGNNYYVDPSDETWKAYTPTGDVTLGDCSCGGGSNGSAYYQALCFEDSTRTKFIRLVRVDGATGAASVIGNYAPDLTGTYTPVGAIAACATLNLEGEPVILCDAVGSFLRHYVYNQDTGQLDSTFDTALDGVTTYAPTGTVQVCTGADLESVDFCMRANTAGTGYAAGDQIKLTRWFNPATNTQVSEVAFNMTQGGTPVSVPLTAANFDECSSSSSLHTVCRCDDTNGDGTPDKKYTSVVRINEDGTITTLGNYTTNLSSVYTPVAPIDCGAGTQLLAVQPRYKVLSGAGTWTLGTDSGPVVQAVSVTVLTHGGAVGLPTVTTNVGASRIYLGQTVAWSVVNDRDKIGLRTPLVITTGAGDLVAVNWSEEVV